MYELDDYVLQSGDYVSPGLYMEYWKAIVRKYGEKSAFGRNSLKCYKEMRVGAILAALWTSSTREKWYVGLPIDEPSDIDLIRMIPSFTKKGTESYNNEKISVQITRCSAVCGEDIIKQIEKKNKNNLSNHILAIDLIGDGQTVDFLDVHKRLQKLTPIYPREIVVVATVASIIIDNIYVSTYLQCLLYPEYRISQIKSSDKDSFFVERAVINVKRGISRDVMIKKFVNLELPQ